MFLPEQTCRSSVEQTKTINWKQHPPETSTHQQPAPTSNQHPPSTSTYPTIWGPYGGPYGGHMGGIWGAVWGPYGGHMGSICRPKHSVFHAKGGFPEQDESFPKHLQTETKQVGFRTRQGGGSRPLRTAALKNGKKTVTQCEAKQILTDTTF